MRAYCSTSHCVSTALAVIAVLLCIGCGQKDEASKRGAIREWKFAIEEVSGSVQDAYAQQCKKLIEKKSQGRIKVSVYPYGSLGTSDEITELVQNGAIQFAMASPGHLGKVIPAVQALLLHFVFSDDNDVNKRVLGHSKVLRKEFDELYRDKGFKFLGLYPEGWQVWTTLDPIRKPQDFDGVKIRVMTSPILVEAYRAYGANPTPLPYGEVYGALQLKMIDAQVNPVFAIEEMSFYEVTNYLIFARQAPFVTSVITNPAFFDALPEKEKEMIREVVSELNDFIFDVQERYNRERLGIIKKNKPDIKILRLTDKERNAFREASLPVRKKFVDMVGSQGKELLDTLTHEIDAAEHPKAG
jgi:tripartite ATP-independent transporter DctP family solute receptor